jgi:hypothetical protein
MRSGREHPRIAPAHGTTASNGRHDHFVQRTAGAHGSLKASRSTGSRHTQVPRREPPTELPRGFGAQWGEGRRAWTVPRSSAHGKPPTVQVPP